MTPAPSEKAAGTPAPAGPARRRRARRGEGQRLREEILDAATDLLIEQGSVEKVSTRAVAERVGCTPPSIYLHFPDKATLVYAVCERQFDELGELLGEAVAGVDEPLERLRRTMHTYAEFAVDRPEQYRVMMMDDSYNDQEAYKDLYAGGVEKLAEAPGFRVVVDAVEAGMESGDIESGDPLVVSLMLWAAVHGLVSLLIVKTGLDLPLDTLFDQLFNQCVEGLRPRASGG